MKIFSDSVVMWVCITSIFMSGALFSLIFLDLSFINFLNGLSSIATITATFFVIKAVIEWRKDKYKNVLHDEFMELSKAALSVSRDFYMLNYGALHKDEKSFSIAASRILNLYAEINQFENELALYTDKDISLMNLGCENCCTFMENVNNIRCYLTAREHLVIGEEYDYVKLWYLSVTEENGSSHDNLNLDIHDFTSNIPEIREVARELKSIDASKLLL
ncbi:hypothetical protein [Vibrio rotiferianus]|uniref:hypothetical protein n=1 Tax=Vibrio rotiferianus TaxID=190895 RepID=UPI0005EE0908|nr:hypothetical protein [Vibrio rotiferianus]